MPVKRKSLCAFSAALMLNACSVVPDYLRIDTPADSANRFINAASDGGQGAPMQRWWERMEDPQFNQYVDILLRDNLSLKEAAERVVQARERLSIERGGYYPTLGADVSANRSFQPAGAGAFSGFGGGSQRFYFTDIRPELTSSWQLDLFGRIGAAVESAEANFVASRYDEQALKHTLISELLTRRVAVAVNARLLELARENALNQSNIYRLVQRRYDLGAAGTRLADVYLAEENYRSVEADVAGFERLLADELYSLDVLLGKMPGSTQPDASRFPLLPPPRDVAVCFPASLLDRRPDLRASELRIMAANADVGVAIADLYPNVSLGASIGFTGDTSSSLFSSDRLVGSLLGSITTRILEGGALRANIRLQEAEMRELAAAYAGQVLEAVRDVESSLKAESELERELAQKEASVLALKNAEKLTEERYREGIETLREFLEIQQRRYLIEQDFLRTQQEKWTARINLYLALGGDWLSENQTHSNCVAAENTQGSDS